MNLFKALFTPRRPPPPRVIDLEQRIEDAETDIAGLKKTVKKLRGLITGELAHQDAPGRTNEGQDGVVPPPDPTDAAQLNELIKGGRANGLFRKPR